MTITQTGFYLECYFITHQQKTIAVVRAPQSQPTIAIDTLWNVGRQYSMRIPALVDTGCNTSLIATEVLQHITDQNGTRFPVEGLHNSISLMSASGNTIDVRNYAELRFKIAETSIKHKFYLMDNMPIPEKIILGMDFLMKHVACIDVAASEITFKCANEVRPDEPGKSLTTQASIHLKPRQTQNVLLKIKDEDP